MDKQQQRIAIAEACGYSIGKKTNSLWDVLKNGKFKTCFSGKKLQSATLADCLKCLPDYLNDLNAMHDAEKILTPTQAAHYRDELESLGSGVCIDWILVHATAAQRAEKFLKVKGLWMP